ncbi:MAG: hypothetical protein DME22_20205 [Verrucomicrobia bacterium]|nr:MAG: hypothetical protein DME22_20205 [Verrucomicrobiota bacterium]PYJ98368.1 MAG: hypothetical protein DME23_12225 [Verrucomicrobiota bacterium]
MKIFEAHVFIGRYGEAVSMAGPIRAKKLAFNRLTPVELVDTKTDSFRAHDSLLLSQSHTGTCS